MRVFAILVALVGLLGLAQQGDAADQPLAGRKLLIKRTGTNEKLVFVSRDAQLLFPALGAADDPGTGTPGGVIIELFSATEGATALAAPVGVGTPGWHVKPGLHDQHKFLNRDAPAPPSPLRAVVLREGKLIKVVARSVGLPLAASQGTVGIRITTGNLRNCALFGPGTIDHDEPGLFLAKDSTTVGLTDCSDASLGAHPCDETVPTCNGTCPAGEECRATLAGYQCVCLPAGSTPCGTPGAPTCGGECPSGQGCVPAFPPIQSGSGVSCGCGLPACGNGFAYGVDDFGQPGCFIVACAGSYPTCGGPCGDGGECDAVHVTFASLTLCVCALPAPCCGGGYSCGSGSVCTLDGMQCSCAPP